MQKILLGTRLITAPYLLTWEYAKGKRFWSEGILFSEGGVGIKAAELFESHIKESLNEVIA